jgi:hypothetical protein
MRRDNCEGTSDGIPVPRAVGCPITGTGLVLDYEDTETVPLVIRCQSWIVHLTLELGVPPLVDAGPDRAYSWAEDLPSEVLAQLFELFCSDIQVPLHTPIIADERIFRAESAAAISATQRP